MAYRGSTYIGSYWYEESFPPKILAALSRKEMIWKWHQFLHLAMFGRGSPSVKLMQIFSRVFSSFTFRYVQKKNLLKTKAIASIIKISVTKTISYSPVYILHIHLLSNPRVALIAHSWVGVIFLACNFGVCCFGRNIAPVIFHQPPSNGLHLQVKLISSAAICI